MCQKKERNTQASASKGHSESLEVPERYFQILTIDVLLTFVVLMQSSKGGGLAGSFGSTNMGAVFGVRRTSDFLAKSTQVLATIFIVLALVINLWLLPKGTTQRESVIQSVPAPATLPPTQTPSGTPVQ